MKIPYNLVDIYLRSIYPAKTWFKDGVVIKIERTEELKNDYILLGLVDSQLHIESSMLTPGAFAMACVPHGTIGIVSYPNEIANVLEMEGIEYMISGGNKVPLKFWFGAPSSIPATEFE